MEAAKVQLHVSVCRVATLQNGKALPRPIIAAMATLREEFEMKRFWEEVAILDAFLKKERRAFRGTPYYSKLEETIRILRRIDELRLVALSMAFGSAIDRITVPCREALLVFLYRLHAGCLLFRKLFPAILKAAKRLMQLASLGHHPSTCHLIVAAQDKAYRVVDIYVKTFNRCMPLNGWFPRAHGTPSVEELLQKVPGELRCVSIGHGIQIHIKQGKDHEEHPSACTDYVMQLPPSMTKRGTVHRPKDLGLEHPHRHKQKKGSSLCNAPPPSDPSPKPKRLSLLDRMQYTPVHSSPKPPSDWEAWLTEEKPQSPPVTSASSRSSHAPSIVFSRVTVQGSRTEDKKTSFIV